MPGPAPTPTETLARRGSWRASERDGEPKPPVPTSVPSSGLSGRSGDIYDSLAPRLHGAGLLTSADLLTFVRYCRLFAAWEKAMQAVEQGGSRSEVLTLAKLDDMVRKLEARFGLSPADRVGLEVSEPPEKDGKARFFDQ